MNAVSKDIPPGPRGRLLTTMRFLRDPKGTTHHWVKKYGDPFCIHALNGSVVMTGRSDLIQQIFSHDPAKYDVFATKAAVPILGSGSMIVMNGPPHRRERKLVMPMFHGERMRAYADIMQRAAINVLDAQPRGQPLKMIDLTTQISLRVIVRAIFGGEDAEPIQKLTQLSEETIGSISPLLLFSTRAHFRFLGISPWDRFEQAREKLTVAFSNEVERRKNDSRPREDILTMLAGAEYEDGSSISPDHLRDELATFLFAGHETTAIAMAWAIYYLHSHPETLSKLKSELGALPDFDPQTIAKQPYLKAVVQESLRLNPIITEVLRVVKEPMEIGGFRLPPDTAVAPAAILAHYNEETFPQPDRFQPERFIDRNYSSSQYLPFGGGHRRCAGAAFALYEMTIVLGTILKRNEFELLETKPVVPRRRNITIGPSTGIRIQKI